MPQQVFTGAPGYAAVIRHMREKGIQGLFLVCDRAVRQLPLDGFFEGLAQEGIAVSRFEDFEPNPRYESVVKGVEQFRQSGCAMIGAIGGGSAMDVAKCVRLYSGLPEKSRYLGREQESQLGGTGLFAIPTTAGTGSEATRYAVIYEKGEKQSVTHPGCLPELVVLDAALLKGLPEYPKKAAMLDALCHGIESAWSVHATQESMGYSLKAVREILRWMPGYLCGEAAAEGMLLAANLAGKAINLTQTTAAHAMSYKLTSLYGLAHGHAAALCLPGLWKYMQEHPERCVDPRGWQHLAQVFGQLAQALGQPDVQAAQGYLSGLLRGLGLGPPEGCRQQDIGLLAGSVNPVRLRNSPAALDEAALAGLYADILSGSRKGE